MTKKTNGRKTCIYLDQFAVSSMVEARKGELWFQIKTNIEKLHSMGKVFCPISMEHFIETSGKRVESAIVHDNYFRSISDSYCIKPELFITAQLISSWLRKNNITMKTYMYHQAIRPMDESRYDRSVEYRKEYRQMLNPTLTNLNTFRNVSGQVSLDSKTKDSLMAAAKKLPVLKFVSRLKELINLQSLRIRGDNMGSKEIPNWIDLIINQLLKTHKLRRKEIRLLIREFEHHGFDNIPTLDIRFSLESLIAARSKNEDRNDQIDIMRIASAFAIADIFLTDKARKHEIEELGLHTKYKTQVYSGTENDRAALLNRLLSM